MKQLGSKVIANYITRMTSLDTARGFYTWLDVTKELNRRRRIIKRTLCYWDKRDRARAFRKWVLTDF